MDAIEVFQVKYNSPSGIRRFCHDEWTYYSLKRAREIRTVYMHEHPGVSVVIVKTGMKFGG